MQSLQRLRAVSAYMEVSTGRMSQAHPADRRRDHDEGVRRVRPDGEVRLVVVPEEQWHVHGVCLCTPVKKARQCSLTMQAVSASTAAPPSARMTA